MEAGIIADADAITWQLRGDDVLAAGGKACKTHVKDIPSAFPKVLYPRTLTVLLTGIVGLVATAMSKHG